MSEKRSALAAFVLAGVAAVAAAATWLIGVVEAREVVAACSSQYAIFADMVQCRAPAVYGAISWLLFTAAIAWGWVGGVRLARNAGPAVAQARRDRNAPPPRDAHPTA